MNLPAVWVDLLLGRSVGPLSYRPGVGYRVEEDDVRALMAMFGRGRRGEALRGLLPRPRTSHAVFSVADPRPIGVSIQKLARTVPRNGDGSAETEPVAELESMRELWSRLAVRSDNIFSTWEWAEVWWRHYGARGSLALALTPTGQALLPMYVERRAGLRVARFVGHGAADQLGPVCDPNHAAAALLTLGRAQIGDVVLAERIKADTRPENLDDVVLREELSPVISCAQAGDWDGFLAMRSANFRQQVRRRERALARAGVRFRLATDRSRLPHDLEALVALHRSRWGAQSTAFAEARERFHREFAQVARDRGWLRLWLAEAEGRVVAAWYGFRFGRVEYFYQSGRDTAWDNLRVGAGLLEHSIREAFADGMREYRLLRGDEPYKLRYATETRRLLTIALAQTPLAHVIVPVTHALATIPSGRALLRKAAY
jgi:CelD/BcsL family acetyltransferase involved in cellulose biosynthesis